MTRRPARSLPTAYFDRKYAFDPDPWGFATSAYEADKYRATLAALPRARYRRALEVGCSIGVLTERLAELRACRVQLRARRPVPQECVEVRQHRRRVRIAVCRIPGQQLGHYQPQRTRHGVVERRGRAAVGKGRGAPVVSWLPAPDNLRAPAVYSRVGGTSGTFLEYELGL